MIGAQPCQDFVAQSDCQFEHFRCLPIRYNTGGLVPADIAFLAEAIELLDTATPA